MDFRDTFATCKVVNLDRFPERWERFEAMMGGLGITGYERFPAIEGDKSPPPRWWKAGNGAWGCMSSHLHIVQRHLTEGNNGHMLVFEDDAVLAKDFVARYKRIMDEVGNDWDMLYFGGQHQHLPQHKPTRHSGQREVITAYNLCRTHAFAVNQRFAKYYQRYIINAPEYMRHTHWTHVDHQLGRLHETGDYKILAVQPWVCGQAAGKSWTCGRQSDEQWWCIGEDMIQEK